MAKKAVVVGINRYGGGNDLPSCVTDAEQFAKYLRETRGFSDIRSLHDEEATVSNVDSALQWLAGGAAAGDQLVFYYSGHGYTAAKHDVFEEYLVLCGDSPLYPDDRLSELSQSLPTGVLTVVLDSCFSGGMDKEIVVGTLLSRDERRPLMKSVGNEQARVKMWIPEIGQLKSEIHAEADATMIRAWGGAPIELPQPGLTKGVFAAKAQPDEVGQTVINGVMLSACLETETAAASTSRTRGMSAFTCCFLDAIQAHPNASQRQLMKITRENLRSLHFRQTPWLVSNPLDLAALVFVTAGGAASGAVSSAPDSSVDVKTVAQIVAAVYSLLAERKACGVSSSLPFKESLMANAEKDLEVVVPLVIEIIDALNKAQQKSSSQPSKDWTTFVPLAIELAQALTKDQQKWGVSFGGGAATPFGGLQAGGTVSSKGWEVIVPIAVEVVRTIAENQQKLGVSFSGGASTPLGGFQGGGAVSFKGWESVVPIAIEIARTLSKGEQQQKLIGIDDAILIPAIASIASALINKI